jgi:hypothetical protein
MDMVLPEVIRGPIGEGTREILNVACILWSLDFANHPVFRAEPLFRQLEYFPSSSEMD